MSTQPSKVTDIHGAVPSQGPLANTTLSGRMILILIGVAVILRVGQEIFVPLALSLLLTFTLAPIVSFLRKRYVPKIAAVILAVVSAFLVIAAFSFIVAGQVANLAENIPTYQRNIVGKVHALSQAGAGNGMLEHLSKVVETCRCRDAKPCGGKSGPFGGGNRQPRAPARRNHHALQADRNACQRHHSPHQPVCNCGSCHRAGHFHAARAGGTARPVHPAWSGSAIFTARRQHCRTLESGSANIC